MNQKLRAIYRKGTFVPTEECEFPEEAHVELLVEGPVAIAPQVADPDERARILKSVTERMRLNPLPLTAARLTREELHARR